MKNLKTISIMLLTMVLFFSSCEKDTPIKPTPTPNYNTEATLDLGSKVAAKFFGRIVDESGNAISGVAITAGNKTATTDNNGIFIIDNASVFEKMAYISAVKSGYFLGSRSVIPSTTATNNVKITMLAMDIVGTVNAEEETTIELTSGASIDFKGKYIDASGNAYTGAVNVSFKHLPALADATPNQMPGMLYAQNQDEEAGVLETYGMMAVELTSSNGAELQIDPESSATIHMPVDASQLANAPATIPLWHFDEVAGYWIEEGKATLVNGEYVGDVTHFSFWNCDAFGDDAQIQGTVVDLNGNLIANVTVAVITPNAATAGQTNSNGTFFTYVPANAAIILQVRDECGNIIQTFNVGPYSTGTVNNETLAVTLTSSNSVQVTGNFLDCSNNLVTNGYVEIIEGSNTYYQTITNGLIDLPILYCNAPTNLTVIGYNFSTLQQSNSASISVTTPITNLGNLIACTAVNEYITYTIDNGTPVVVLTNITAQEYSGNIYVNAYGNGSSFNLQSSSTTLGSYSYDSSTGMTMSDSTAIEISTTPIPSINFDLNSYGAVGSYVDINFSGTYEDFSNVQHSITGTVHAIRD